VNEYVEIKNPQRLFLTIDIQFPLRAIVSTQRRQYKILTSGGSESTPMTPERASRLMSIGFEWATKDPRHVPWETRYTELIRFVVRPDPLCSSSVNSLAVLTPTPLLFIVVAGKVWPCPGADWMGRKCPALQLGLDTGACKETTGWQVYPCQSSRMFCFSTFLIQQRQEYKLLRKGRSSRLTSDRIKLLNSVGFVWEAQRGGPRRRRKSNNSIGSSQGRLSADEASMMKDAAAVAASVGNTGIGVTGAGMGNATGMGLGIANLRNRGFAQQPAIQAQAAFDSLMMQQQGQINRNTQLLALQRAQMAQPFVPGGNPFQILAAQQGMQAQLPMMGGFPGLNMAAGFGAANFPTGLTGKPTQFQNTTGMGMGAGFGMDMTGGQMAFSQMGTVGVGLLNSFPSGPGQDMDASEEPEAKRRKKIKEGKSEVRRGSESSATGMASLSESLGGELFQPANMLGGGKPAQLVGGQIGAFANKAWMS
jgi:hypothetical protein